ASPTCELRRWTAASGLSTRTTTASAPFLATNADTRRDSSGEVLYLDQRNRSQPSRPGESEAASSCRLKPGRRRDQAVEMAALIPAVASTSTSSIFNCFSGSSRMTPSVDAVTVQSAATLSVAPDGSLTVRSRVASADAAAGAAT